MSKAQKGVNPKDLLGMKKPPLALCPPVLEIITSLVMKLGAKKYGAYNWREKSVRRTVYLEAAKRHIDACLDGEDEDSETHLPHEASAAACMGIVLDALVTGNLVDDRPTPGAAAKVIALLTEVERLNGAKTFLQLLEESRKTPRRKHGKARRRQRH